MNTLYNLPKKQVITNGAVSLLLSFTFFMFAPVSLYAANSSEFWFGIGDMIPIMTIGLVITFTITFMLLCFTKGKFHDITLAVIFALGLAFYIQGNWLPADYGVLDGRAIAWENYQSKAIVNLILWILLIVTPIVFVVIKRSSAENVFKWTASFILERF